MNNNLKLVPEFNHKIFKNLYKYYNEDDMFIDWLVNKEVKMNSFLDALYLYLSDNDFSRNFHFKEFYIKGKSESFFYHIGVDDSLFVVSKYLDKSMSNLVDSHKLIPSEILKFISES
jgi:hypothetical protein